MTRPDAAGEAHYRHGRARAGGNLITASAAGGLLFARLVLERMDVLREEALEASHEYYATGEAGYFAGLPQPVPQGASA